MKKLLKKRKLFAFVMMLMVCSAVLFANPVTAHASSAEKVKDAFSEGDMFSATEDVVKEAGGSLKSLITTVAIIVLVISVIFVGMQLASKNSAKRQEAKSNLGAIIAGAILIFAAVAVISLSGTIAESLESTVTEESDGN